MSLKTGILNFSNFLSTPSVSKEEIRSTLFPKEPFVPSFTKQVSGLSLDSCSMVADYTSLYRSFVHDLFLGKQFPHNLALIGNYHLFGTASGVNAPIGIMQAIQAAQEGESAKALGDHRAHLMSNLGIAKGLSLAGAGLSYALFRPLALIDAIKQAPSLIGRASALCASAGTICYAVFFVFLSTIFGIRVYENYQFKRALQKAKTPEEFLALIQKKTEVDREKLVAKLGEKGKEQLIEEGFKTGIHSLKTLLKELNIPEPSDEKLKTLLEKLLEKSSNGWTKAQVEQEVKEALFQAGLQMRIHKTQLKKEGKLARVLGRQGMEAIQTLKKDRTLAEKIVNKDPEALEKTSIALGIIQSANQKKLLTNLVVLTVCLLGIAAMVAAIVFTSGGALAIAAALMLVFSLLMTGVDLHFLLESYKEETPAPFDKKLLILSSIVGALSFLVLMGLGISGATTMGILPLTIAVILLSIWLGQNSASWAILKRNERLHNIKHPTLETLLQAIENKEKEEDIAAMLENLSEEIKEELRKESQVSKQAILSLIHKVEEAKKKQLEGLRETLTPLLME